MTDYQLNVGEGDIQDLGDMILRNKLYINDTSLNYVIASKANNPKEGYRRYLHYVTLTLNGEVIGLCMLVEQGSGEVFKCGLHYYSDAFFSVYVKPDYRLQGYATQMAAALAEHLHNYFNERMAKYSRYSVMADVKGAPFARKYFPVPVVCGGFPTWKGIKRVVARMYGKPFEQDFDIDDNALYMVEPRGTLLAQYY